MNDETPSSSQVPKLFDEAAGMALAAQTDAAAVARATQEIQAALVIAQRFPREVIKIKAKILEACKRAELAQVAEYEYSRGGTRITGPTIDLLRAIANRWGNVRFGWTEVERRDGVSSVRCFAWDLQTNAQAERTFNVRHVRDTKQGGYELKDERDIYEMLANQAARRVRACLEEVIDSDIVIAAVDQCRLTLKSAQKEPMSDRMTTMLSSLAPFGVTAGMIEIRLGNKLDAVSENQYASLYRVWKSLKDGVGTREDYFKPEVSKPEFANKVQGAAVAQTLAGEKAPPVGPAAAVPSKPEPQAEPEPEPATRAPNPIKQLRHLLKAGSIPEGVLLDFWSSVGSTDGSAASLEEVAIANGQLIKMTAEQWPEFLPKLLERKKAAK